MVLVRLSALCAALASAAAFAPVGPAALPKGQSTAARASLTSLHMGKNIFQKKEIIKSVRADLENAQLIFSTDMSELNINQVAMNPCFRVVRFGPHTSARSMLQFDDKT